MILSQRQTLKFQICNKRKKKIFALTVFILYANHIRTFFKRTFELHLHIFCRNVKFCSIKHRNKQNRLFANSLMLYDNISREINKPRHKLNFGLKTRRFNVFPQYKNNFKFSSAECSNFIKKNLEKNNYFCASISGFPTNSNKVQLVTNG